MPRMIRHPPTLETERLVLRPFRLADAGRVRELAGDRAIYETTLNVPHPYEEGMAERWIASHAHEFFQGRGMTWAVTQKDGELVGAIGLAAEPRHGRAELGYWIGVPYWNRGYCTEAARAVLACGFETLGCHRILAHHLEENPASGRVMEKAGMVKEGVLRDHVRKDGRYRSIVVYGLVRTEE